MYKGIRLIKRVVALFLVLLLSIESFGAVVSDNDGSAFITKAEFDSLKNNFQSQIDQYNTSIDSKIDGAIASYLAGINIKKTEDLKILVSNYNEMKWMPDLKLYGRYVYYSAPGTLEHDSTAAEWYRPHLGERRATLTVRGDTIWVWDQLNSTNYTTGTHVIRMTPDDWDGISQCPAWTCQYENTESSMCFPICLVRIKTDALDNCEIDSIPFRQTEGASNVLETLPHHVYDGGNTYNSWWSNKGFKSISNLNFLSVGEGEYLKYTVDTTYAPYNAPTTENTRTLSSVLNITNALWPQNTYWFSLNRTEPEYNYWDRYKNIPDATGYGSNHGGTWWQDGATWQYIESTTHNRQCDAIYHMMLGADNDQIVNVARPFSGRHPKYNIYDFTGSPGAGRVHFTTVWSQIGIFSGQYSWASQKDKSEAVGGWLSIPYWPREYWKNLTSGNFVYNNKNIKMGEGLILVDDATDTGNLKISFNYNIGTSINDVDYTRSQSLFFDLKKTSFLEESVDSDYFEGWLGDSEGEQISKIHFKDYEYSARDGKIKLFIPIKKAENLYIRLRPAGNQGEYAQISNLKITLEVE